MTWSRRVHRPAERFPTPSREGSCSAFAPGISPLGWRPGSTSGAVTSLGHAAYRGSMNSSNRRLDTPPAMRSIPEPAAPSGQKRPDGRRRQLRGPFTRWPRAADLVLVTVMLLMSLFVVEGPNETIALRPLGEVPTGAFFVGAAASFALIWRRRHPLTVLATTLAATSLATVFDYSDQIGLTLLIALYSVGRNVTSDRWSRFGLGSVPVLLLIIFLVDETNVFQIGFGLVIMSTIWYVGRRMRLRSERAAQLEREQEAEARRALADERTRIARELHDVVAHRVSLMTVQAGAAKIVAVDDPESAMQAMEAVEKAGRQALDELRHLLGVLRPEAVSDTLGPQPGLADIPRLVDQFQEAGLDVSLRIEGVQTDLPAPVDLSAFRIVQEALTNSLKHAGPSARTEVRLSTDDDEVAIEVLDNGRGATILPGSGHGIAGMRERALLLAGNLDARPRPGGGFQVVARLPIGREPT